MIFNYFFGFYKKHKLKTIILIFNISIYFALTVSMFSLNRVIPKILSLPFESIGIGIIVQKEGEIPGSMVGAIFPHSNGPIYDEEIDEIANLDFVQNLDKGLYFWYFDDQYFKTILGVQNNSVLADLLQQNIKDGNCELSYTKILITADFSQKHNLGLGKEVYLGNNEFVVSGILQQNLTGNVIPADIYLDLNQAQKIAMNSKEMQRSYNFKNSNFVNVLMLNVNPEYTGNKEQEIKNIDENYIVFSEKNFSEEVLSQIKLISSLGKITFIILGIIFLVIFIFLVRYILKAREDEIALLRIIGWGFQDLKKIFLGEIIFLLGISILIGNLLSLLSTYLLKQKEVTMELPWEISAKPHFLPQENSINRIITTSLPVDFDLQIYIAVSVIFLVIGIVVYYAVFNRIKNIKPMEYI